MFGMWVYNGFISRSINLPVVERDILNRNTNNSSTYCCNCLSKLKRLIIYTQCNIQSDLENKFWVLSNLLAIMGHLWPVAKCPMIMWFPFAIFSFSRDRTPTCLWGWLKELCSCSLQFSSAEGKINSSSRMQKQSLDPEDPLSRAEVFFLLSPHSGGE